MMSVEAVRWAFALDAITYERDGVKVEAPPAARLVLVALAWKADRDGYAWPSQVALAEMTGLDVGNVRRHVGALEKAGLVKRLPRERRSDGRYAGATYRVECPASTAHVRAVDQRAPVRGGPAREIGENQRALARGLDKDRTNRQLGSARVRASSANAVVDNSSVVDNHDGCFRCFGSGRIWNAAGGFEVDCPAVVADEVGAGDLSPEERAAGQARIRELSEEFRNRRRS